MNENKKKTNNQNNQTNNKKTDAEVFIHLAKCLYETVVELEKVLENRSQFFSQEINETTKKLDYLTKRKAI